jgi:hypothetical protein
MTSSLSIMIIDRNEGKRLTRRLKSVGDHESMFHDPHVDILSRRLRQALQPGI